MLLFISLLVLVFGLLIFLHSYHHLHRLHNSRTTISTLIYLIKPCTYRITCFSGEHQSCHNFNHCNNFILDLYVSQKNRCCHKVFVQQGHVRIILLPELVTYVLIRTPPITLNLIPFVAISY